MKVGELDLADFGARLSAGGIAFQWGPFSTTLVCELPELSSPLHKLYCDFPLVNDGISDFHVSLRKKNKALPPFGVEAQFFRDDVQPFAPFARSVALCMFEWGLNWCVYSSAHKFLILHAAVIARDGRALLLSGRPGAGKSTLCAALVASGWRLLSDELTLIDPDSLNIYPLCRPICLKEESIDHMKQFAPDAVFGPVVKDTHKGAVCHMRPPAESLARISELAYPSWIVLPQFDAGVDTHTTPLSKASAFFELADNSFNYEILGKTAFQALSRVIETIDCYRLNHANTADGIAEIDRLTTLTG